MQRQNFKFNPFDPKKVWPHKEFPQIRRWGNGTSSNFQNYFADCEQIAAAHEWYWWA